MYFDAVLRKNTNIVLFNGTPEETREYLKKVAEADQDKLIVIRGVDLISYSVSEYLELS